MTARTHPTLPTLSRPLAFAVALLAAQAPARAQFNDAWVGFQQDFGRLVAPAHLGLADTQEKDYAWGDLDQDGFVDLVVARKQPFSNPGKHPNVLLMNEGGVLTDRTAQYAAASDVPGDQGFLTATNDRDIQVVDVDADGWLDVVTATTYGLSGEPKSLTHPRVYMNLGQDAGGSWLGLRYEEARIPQLQNQAGSANIRPDYCEVATGDVTGDGFPDLWFVDYGGDGDRLLVNDGSGFFTDESQARSATSSMWNVGAFGTSGAIVDLNGDGANDVVHNHTLGGPGVQAVYNDPGNVGFFNILQSGVNSHAPYHVVTGDLNADGKPDAVVTDDVTDRFHVNNGNDALGRVQWSEHAFTFVTGSDPGIGGNNKIADLDGDGWNDVLICDIDVDIPGCSRRTAIYHNRGTVVGAVPELREEAESPTGWRGAVGLTVADLTGVFDAAIFDIDGDGDLDLVLGKCGTTTIWMNQSAGCAAPATYCTAKVTSGGCIPVIGATGTPSPTGAFAATCSKVEPGQPGLVFWGAGGEDALPFQGGFLCVAAPVIREGVQSSGGAAACTGSYSTDLSAVVAAHPLGTQLWCQYWFRDPGAASSTGLSDGLTFTTCP